MPEPTEHSEAGHPIYRYGERTVPRDIAHGDDAIIEAIGAHIEEYLGEPAGVYHELVSDLVHIDVHVVAPGPGRPFHTLVTSGMSSAPMIGHGEDGPFQSYAELCCLLPPDWKLEQKDFKDFANYFPIHWLKFLARFPHEYDTWLSFGHTIPNGDPAEPVGPNVDFIGWILLPPIRLPEAFHTLELDANRSVDIFAIVPLHADEMDFKLKHGTEALLDLFDEHGVTELIDPKRPSVVDS